MSTSTSQKIPLTTEAQKTLERYQLEVGIAQAKLSALIEGILGMVSVSGARVDLKNVSKGFIEIEVEEVPDGRS